ncbi:MAG TPA: heme-copper oxidase subunit III [Dehalococcoidia bacterium]|nr:heme-copper oxidase subunit III [Dehalococcoidia bacterium]
MATEAAIHGHGHGEPVGISRGMAGMAFFIASEVMLFGGLLAGYFYLRNQASAWPPEGVEHELSVSFAAVLTVILISSSITAHFGMVGIMQGNRAAFRIGITLSIILGGFFIGGQIYEWFTLMDEGLTASSNVYGSTFYLITGFHGAHVIAGLCMLVWVLLRAFWNDFTPTRHLFAEAAVSYWHFVDVIWVFVYTILYISPKL